MDVRLPDGTIIQNVPDGTTKADLVAKLQGNGMAVPSEWLQAAPPAQPVKEAGQSLNRGLSDILRQIGLTARYALEGPAQAAQIFTEPVAGLMRAAGIKTKPLGEIASGLADTVGLPKPETSQERVVGDATRLLAGTGGVLGASRAAAQLPGMVGSVGAGMAANPTAQMTGAVGAGRRLVTGRKNDGRAVYDPQAKAEVVRACLQPDVSVARMALQCGINANLLRRWITQSMGSDLKASRANLPTVAMASTSAFVPLRLAAPEASPVTAAEVKTRLHARLPNGVEIDLSDADPGGLLPVLELLGRLPCSGSTTR